MKHFTSVGQSIHIFETLINRFLIFVISSIIILSCTPEACETDDTGVAEFVNSTGTEWVVVGLDFDGRGRTIDAPDGSAYFTLNSGNYEYWYRSADDDAGIKTGNVNVVQCETITIHLN